MIPNVRDRELESSGVADSAMFGISRVDEAHILSILRDTLYSDKVLAVLREYGSNAWDANRMVGKGDVPIQVTLPTYAKPELAIRDHGPGLSREDVFKIYTQYGASTKRSDDNTVGMLGIGSKSGFAYADSFTVTSWNGGKKCVYVAVLDKTDKGIINLLHEEDCGEETGVQIQLSVQHRDIPEFENTAKKLYKHFIPRPKINIPLPPVADTIAAVPSGVIYSNKNRNYDDRGWTAVMGCVPYRIDLSQLSKGDGEEKIVYDLSRLSGVLYFNIGEVQINASREELKYSDSTRASIRNKVNSLIDEFVTRTLAEIDATTSTPWARMIKSQVFDELGLIRHIKSEKIVPSSISLAGHPDKFWFTRQYGKEHTRSITVSESARIVIKDLHKRIKGFDLRWEDIVARSDGIDPVILQKNVEDYIESKGMKGIPIIKLSDIPYSPTKNESVKSSVTPKQSIRVFLFSPRGQESPAPGSAQWTPVEKYEPKPEDVFVVLDAFRVTYAWADLYKEMMALFKVFKKPMPLIYGYRHTKTKPVLRQNIIGTEFVKWYNSSIHALFEEHKQEIEDLAWARAGRSMFHVSDSARKIPHLRKSHPLRVAVDKMLASVALLGKLEYRYNEALEKIKVRRDTTKYPDDSLEVFKTFSAFKKDYPLLFLPSTGIEGLWSDEREHWVQYVHMMDKLRESEKGEVKNEVG